MHWSAFGELSTERQIGMAVGPIPVSAIRRHFIEQWDFCGAELDHAVAVIRETDGQYLQLKTTNTDDDPPMRERVSASDPKAVKNLMRGLSRPKRKR